MSGGKPYHHRKTEAAELTDHEWHFWHRLMATVRHTLCWKYGWLFGLRQKCLAFWFFVGSTLKSTGAVSGCKLHIDVFRSNPGFLVIAVQQRRWFRDNWNNVSITTFIGTRKYMLQHISIMHTVYITDKFGNADSVMANLFQRSLMLNLF